MSKGRAWIWSLGLALLLALLALAQTHPLWRYFWHGLPYGYHVVPGYEIMPLMPGDHTQFYYWCWLMLDNLIGPSGFLTNPYEFNSFLSQGISGFANFPFSLLYVMLSPLGPVGAYNALVILSYVLAGLCAYAFAHEVLQDRLAALPAALIYALLPFRAAQVLSGHLYGFVAFMLPLTLFCLERGIKRRSWLWGGAAGLCLLGIARMEGHLIYYTALLLGLYLPLRLIMLAPDKSEDDSGGIWAPWLVLLAGLGLGFTAHLAGLRGGGAALWSLELAASLMIYPLLTLSAWLVMSGLLNVLAGLEPKDARLALARVLGPFAASPLYAVQFSLDIPHLGAGIMAALLLAGLIWAWPLLRGIRPRPPAWDWGLMKPLLPAGLGMASAVGFMLYVKATAFDGSIAGQGRGLHEVKLFTPHLQDLFDLANVHMERLVHLGYVVPLLALAGLLTLVFARRPLRSRSQAAVWALIGVLGMILSLGPTLSFLPLYELLYKHLPFFNFPRVPGRMIIVAVLFLALLAGWMIKELRSRWPRGSGFVWAGALILLLSLGTWPRQLTGISLLPPEGKVEAAVRNNLPTGPQAEKRLLGLPIWPGDSHQSAAYELMITRTRAKMINGYSPVVPREYVQKVYEPLYPLDLGLVNQKAIEALDKNRVGQVVFFDDDQVYARKVSPFPPALARQRLMSSGAFTPLAREGNMFLWSLKPGSGPDKNPGQVTSPVTSLWEAEWLPRNAGRLLVDQEASGWGLLYEEPPDIGGPLGERITRRGGNVVQAKAGDNPGYLCFGPYKTFPPGSYRVRFRLRRGPGPVPGRVDITTDKGNRLLAEKLLDPKVLPPDGAWHDVNLGLNLEGLTNLEFRVKFDGPTDLAVDAVLVNFARAIPENGFFLAQKLWRQAGDLMDDDMVPGSLAVAATPGRTPNLYLIHGPQQTVDPGRYRARFRIAGAKDTPPGAVLAHLAAATDLGRRVLAHKTLTAKEAGDGDYRDIELEFEVKRRLEVGLRVRYAGGGPLRLAGVELASTESQPLPGSPLPCPCRLPQ